jgi:hypothetical protein
LRWHPPADFPGRFGQTGLKRPFFSSERPFFGKKQKFTVDIPMAIDYNKLRRLKASFDLGA